MLCYVTHKGRIEILRKKKKPPGVKNVKKTKNQELSQQAEMNCSGKVSCPEQSKGLLFKATGGGR